MSPKVRRVCSSIPPAAPDGPFSARGFDVDTILYDGFPTSFLTYIPSSEANLAMYDRVEIVRGATGLAQGAGSPRAPST